MCEDKEVLDEYFLFVKESLWLYILSFMMPSIAPKYFLTELLVFIVALYTTFLCRHFPNTRWNDKIAVLKKTTLQLYFKTFLKKSIQVTWLYSRADIYSM